MSDSKTVFHALLNGIDSTAKNCGFSVILPEGLEKGDLPATVESGRTVINFEGENIALRIDHHDDKIIILGAKGEGILADAAFSPMATCLFDVGQATEKDINYVINEFNDSINMHFGKKNAAFAKNVKMPIPVSKNAAKSGAVFYDPNTLASRLTQIYPELRPAYKNNVEYYSEFLPEDFFLNHANATIRAIVKENNPQKMKKLFNLLNEIYLDGTNETQSLIAVTVLGQFNDDEQLLANCVDYMEEDLCQPVIQVNKILSSRGGKNARMRLESPPKYKPKKPKRKSAMERLSGM